MYKALFMLILVISYTQSSFAGIYTCTVQGKKVFQGVPCSKADENSRKEIKANTNVMSDYKRPLLIGSNFEKLLDIEFLMAEAVKIAADCRSDLDRLADSRQPCEFLVAKMLPDNSLFSIATKEAIRLIRSDQELWKRHRYKFEKILDDKEWVLDTIKLYINRKKKGK